MTSLYYKISGQQHACSECMKELFSWHCDTSKRAESQQFWYNHFSSTHRQTKVKNPDRQENRYIHKSTLQ